MALCDGSNIKRHVSDYDVAFRRASCPICGRKLKITIPDRKMYGNVARFPKHAVEAKNQ
jgi:hypothetical protein